MDILPNELITYLISFIAPILPFGKYQIFADVRDKVTATIRFARTSKLMNQLVFQFCSSTNSKLHAEMQQYFGQSSAFFLSRNFLLLR